MRLLPLLRASLLALLVGVPAAVGCSSSDDGAPAPAPSGPAEPEGGLPLLGADCDPMVPTACGLPFPSNVYLVDDDTTVTKKRVAFGKTTLPLVFGKRHTKPETWAKSDGFSAGQAPFTHLPGATATGLPDKDHLELSVTTSSPTILLDAETGELIPHFAEIDMSTTDEEERSLMIRPVVRLKDAHRYVVAIRDVVDASGAALPPSDVFKALRDGADHADASVRRRRALYDEIFAKLEAAGVSRQNLQIAWDYSTASRENNTRSLLHMRDDALATVGEAGPAYEVQGVVDASKLPTFDDRLAKRLDLRMTVPLYLDVPEPGGRLVLGDDGLPKQNGTAEFGVTVLVPKSATPDNPAALLQHGHGLLGNREIGGDDHLIELANQKNYVIFTVDLIGLSSEDFEWIANSIVDDIGGLQPMFDRQQQGILNSLLAMRMMRGSFWKDPEVTVDEKPIIDPSLRFYRGDSMGGIFGTTYMTLSTDVTRGMLGVPGMPFNLLLNRSTQFGQFFVLLRGVYATAMDLQLALGLTQMLWDRTDPSGFAPYLAKDTLPGTEPHQVLLHAALGDYMVTPLGAHILARTVGAKNLKPVNRSLYGLEEVDGPVKGSTLVEFSFPGVDEAPKTNTPPKGSEENDPHGWPRTLQASHDQTDHFFRTGEVKQFCDGACDPE